MITDRASDPLLTTPLISRRFLSPGDPPSPPRSDHAMDDTAPGGSTTADNEVENIANPKRQLTFIDGVTLVLGLQIGSSIFTSPSLVVRNAGSEPAALLIWCLTGCLAWAYAVCYIELGTLLPVNGRPQEYLTYCFGELYGFLASFGCIFAAKPCSTAILAVFISDYLCSAFGVSLDGPLNISIRKMMAVLVVAVVAAVNCIGNKSSNAMSKILLACKLVGVGFVIGSGLIFLIFPFSPPNSPSSPEPVAPLRSDLSVYIDAILSAMWAYSGWETVRLHGHPIFHPCD